MNFLGPYTPNPTGPFSSYTTRWKSLELSVGKYGGWFIIRQALTTIGMGYVHLKNMRYNRPLVLRRRVGSDYFLFAYKYSLNVNV